MNLSGSEGGSGWLCFFPHLPTDRMTDDAALCRRAESRLTLVSTCNLTDTEGDVTSGVLRGQRPDFQTISKIFSRV